VRKHVDIGMIKAGKQKVVNCGLEGLNVVEDGHVARFGHDRPPIRGIRDKLTSKLTSVTGAVP
jgi:hypothetical protein